MYMYDIGNQYFRWVCEIIRGKQDISQYFKLLSLLSETKYFWTFPMDANRAKDGIGLRFDFFKHATTRGLAKKIDVESYFRNRECSVLEMLIALAIRMESIMTDWDEDHTDIWFWTMLENLDLMQYTDDRFNSDEVSDIIENLLTHRYEPDGTGGLFVINNLEKDLRDCDIWTQMNLYLNEYLNEEGE